VSDFIQPLISLLQLAVSQLRQPKVQRAEFEKSLVEPLNEKFEQMYENHIATFRQVRAMILASRPAAEIGSFVRETILFEQNVTEVLYGFTRRDHPWQHLPGGDELNDAFIEYVASIARCLRSPSRDTTVLVYYASLDDLARDLPNAPREESVRRLDEIITRFQSFYGDVKANHLRLKRLCSI
jgi:hypothetical protein